MATMQLVCTSTNGASSPPVATAIPKYTAASTATTTSARRGTPPGCAPRATQRGRSPSRPSDAPSLANAPRYVPSTPSVTIPATSATSTRPTPGRPTSTRSISGTSDDAAWSPSTVTVTHCRARYAAPTTTSAIAVARGMVRRGSRNSPAMWVTASQPANAQTYRLAAAPTPDQPCGANGTRSPPSAAGSETSTTPTTSTTRAPVRASWTGPARRSPTALTTSGGTRNAAPTTGTCHCAPPSMATTYCAPSSATTGEPTHTPKKNQ